MLNLGAGGDDNYIMPQRPTGTVLPVGAIARMVAAALGVDHEAR